jgi:hypothetical protein
MFLISGKSTKQEKLWRVAVIGVYGSDHAESKSRKILQKHQKVMKIHHAIMTNVS